MRNLDLSPLWRSTVGFDRLFDLLDDSLRWTGEDNYPPYNIERTGEDNYQVALALAGFKPGEIAITADEPGLFAKGIIQVRIFVSCDVALTTPAAFNVAGSIT